MVTRHEFGCGRSLELPYMNWLAANPLNGSNDSVDDKAAVTLGLEKTPRN